MYKTLVSLILFLPITVQAEQCTILLHGLARTENSMSVLEKELSKAGYKVVNIGYESTKHTVEGLADSFIPIKAVKECEKYSKIHFVTHSMGGILVRYYLSKIQSKI